MSQHYTPVEWRDETPSQQGTLINAARLNVMQTAHHYADGFTEVDAIPTDPPAEDRPAVVFCTANHRLYRWDQSAQAWQGVTAESVPYSGITDNPWSVTDVII